MAPTSSLRNSTLSHDFPPSWDLKTPRWLLGPKAWPRAATYTRSAFSGWTLIRAMCRVSSSPKWTQVLPPSVDL